MVWKQDLAKLKQSFREAGGPPPPPVKPKPKPAEVKDLDDEDAMFLAAMGGRAPRPPAPAPAAPPPPPVAAEPPVSFETGLGDLKGLKPLARNPVIEGPAKVPAKHPEPVAAAAPEPPPAAPARPVELPRELPVGGAVRIHLAAGMAVEVDAALDLRGHSAQDALGRLRDRVEDGAFLGWRTLHVTLGEDEALHTALMAFLAEAGRIGRYAQAPIPMGGAQAWVLYY